MLDFSDLLRPEAILTNVTAASRKALFQQLGVVAGRMTGLHSEIIADKLADREKLGSTGFGGGVAIPHAKITGVQSVTGVFAQLARGLEFRAVDSLPVDLVFMLLSPIDAGADHLKALARVSRRMRDRAFVAKLRGAVSRDALCALLAADGARDAA